MKTKYLNKKFGIALACIGLGFTLLQSACTKNFEKYNTNKYNLTDSLLKIDGEGLGTFMLPMELGVVNSTNYNFQVQENLNADIFSGFMMTADAGFNPNNHTYGLNSGWNTAAFDLGFGTIMADWVQVKARVTATSQDYLAVANILKVEGMHRVTDVYGPMPYTQVGVKAFSVPYDSQETIYKTFFDELDFAIKTLTQYVKDHPGATPFKPYDLIYGGDYKEWIKFANSLKLRLAIRISMVNPAMAKTEAESAVSDPGGLITTNGDNAYVKAANGVTFTNPLWSVCYEYLDIQAGAPLECYLQGYNDPRLAAYFVKNKNGEYRGIRNGIVLDNSDEYAIASNLNLTNTSPIRFMAASEISFLRAEGALRGWSMGGTPQSFYEQGVNLSFDQSGVAPGNYLSDATSTEANYVDLVRASNNASAGSKDISTITIKWNEADTYQRKLERIITQKWLGLWPDGNEAWAEQRRTNYPVLMRVVVNNSQGTISTDNFIRRLPFSQKEYDTNKDQVTKAVSLLSGPDNGGTRLWWDLATKN
ncbi:SusD/RagB family nutrient-binding outer membrane lipoprotein [Mucilaginibacter sp. BJC16-A38]|uniref:RagB/SusD family nutrient uptake outer membrane protein n=1 Tax=Mucilaginibacter phenanthrenivorans TaxID=1234842 RepID=UPI00215795D8|nr:RagB/SusD family nutrient uptake outer membrane protein [Mucilaginibacter phenanthrenivorans]MCR8557565.1 SusD/RagB family nutrient-binding outer membrane lipoprotein [Mucilaginibacter phenanthrenivorans]